LSEEELLIYVQTYERTGFTGEIRDLDCGHWTQQEKPEEVNALIRDWIVRDFRQNPSEATGE